MIDVAQSSGTAKESRAKPRRVLIVGFPRLAAPLPQLISDERWQCTFAPTGGTVASVSSDLVYQVGGGPIIYPKILAACRALGKPVIKHWVGTDVLRSVLPHVQRQYRKNAVHHWAVTPWLASELAANGIDASVVPLSVLKQSTPKPLAPPPLTLLCYAPKEKFRFYGGPLVLSLAQAHPDVRFLIVANDGAGVDHPPNVAFLGYRSDMDAIYARTHALVRFVDHDGLSYMVLEALEAGRHVLWNRPLPGVRCVTSVEALTSAIGRLREELLGGVLRPNDEGRARVTAEYLHPIVASVIRRGFEDAVSQRSSERRRA
jgi:hypothetical protein